MPTPIDRLRQYLTNQLGSTVVRGGTGYVAQEVDPSFKPKASKREFIKPLAEPTTPVDDFSAATAPPSTPSDDFSDISDVLGSIRSSFQPKTISGSADPTRLAEEQKVLQNQLRDAGFEIPGQVSGAVDEYKNTLPKVSDQSPLGQTGNVWADVGRPARNPYSNAIRNIFGDDANTFEQILRWGTPGPGTRYGVHYGGENLSFKPDGVNVNSDGSRDIGLAQINENTYNDFVRRKGDQVRAAGIGSYEDLFDPILNLKMAKIIFDEQGASAWYGAPVHANN